MKTLYILVRNNLKILILKNPLYTISFVILPIIISVALTAVLSQDSKLLKISVIDKNNTVTSKVITESLNNNKNIKVTNLYDDLESALKMDSISGAVVIDKEFESKLFKGDTSGVEVYGATSGNTTAILRNFIQPDLLSLGSIYTASKGNYEVYKDLIKQYTTSQLSVQNINFDDSSNDYSRSLTLISFLIMFSFLRAMNGAALIGDDKEQKTYNRIILSQVSKWQYYLANIISTIILLLIQTAFTLIIIELINNITFGINIFLLFIVLGITSIVSVSIGSFCVMITDNRELSNIVSTFVLIAFLLLGGGLVPVELLPGFIDKISYLTPPRWAIDSVISLQQGLSFYSVIPNLVVMLIFSIIFFIISVYSVSKRDSYN